MLVNIKICFKIELYFRKEQMPKISVIMPVYNAERYIKIAVDSILNQTFKDFELIVIDDKGTDDSIKIVEEISDPRIRILHNEKNYIGRY